MFLQLSSNSGLLKQSSQTNSYIRFEHVIYIIYISCGFNNIVTVCVQPPTVVCSICKRDGHLKDDCPEDFKKMELTPLPPMTERFREVLDNLCKRCYGKWLSSATLAKHQQANYVKIKYWRIRGIL